jgi:parallel beta-helix repeat protein
MSYMRRILLVCLAVFLFHGFEAVALTQPLAITPTSATLEVGQSVKLYASMSGATWTSSNLVVATVTPYGGWVTAKSAGKVTITAKLRNYRGYVTVTVVAPPPPPLPPDPLVLSCPSNISQVSPDGSPVAVDYQATAAGGVAPVSVEALPASGSLFPVGVSSVSVSASSADGQFSNCAFNVSVTYTPPPPPPPTSPECGTPGSTKCGQQADIFCPAGVELAAGQGSSALQALIDANIPNTTFCIKDGSHPWAGSVTPKTGDTFIGEFGAILDGTGWAFTDLNQGAFRCHNQDIDNVTIKNLEIRNMPAKAIGAFFNSCDRWIVENNTIHDNRIGVHVGNYFGVRYNKIYNHHGDDASTNPNLRGGGYVGYKPIGTVLEYNEIYDNGPEQKIFFGQDTIMRHNYVHGGAEGLWCDGCGNGNVIEGNIVEDVTGDGIFYEASGQGIIRNNTLTRAGILVSVSYNVEVYGNTINDALRGTQFFLDCRRLAESNIIGPLSFHDLYAHDNTFTVPTTGPPLATTIFFLSTCTAEQQESFAAQNIRFDSNRYLVPSLTTKYWMFGYATKTFADWQALGQDTAGSAVVR